MEEKDWLDKLYGGESGRMNHKEIESIKVYRNGELIETWSDLFDVPELEFAPEYDSHKPEDIDRLLALNDLNMKNIRSLTLKKGSTIQLIDNEKIGTSTRGNLLFHDTLNKQIITGKQIAKIINNLIDNADDRYYGIHYGLFDTYEVQRFLEELTVIDEIFEVPIG